MDVNVNGVEKAGAAANIAGAIDARLKAAHCDGLTSAMTMIWEERGKYPVLSEAFFALTRVWEQLCAERVREEAKGKS